MIFETNKPLIFLMKMVKSAYCSAGSNVLLQQTVPVNMYVLADFSHKRNHQLEPDILFLASTGYVHWLRQSILIHYWPSIVFNGSAKY